MKKVFFVCMWLFLVIPCRARIITVDDDGPADFNNIAAAIDDAIHGDTVLVKPGSYSGVGNRDIDFDGKAITVRSEGGAEVTIIDCENSGYGFYIEDNETAEARLEGFTICHAFHGAIKVYSSSPPRKANGLTTSKAFIDPLYDPNYADVVISNCAIVANLDGGIYFDGHDNVTITNCIIARNGAEGVYSYMSWPTIKNCVIVNNNSTGIRATAPTIINCTVAGNLFYGIRVDDAVITNCIVWGNSRGQIQNWDEDATVTYSDVQGGWRGDGNIDVDPLFVDADNGDYHLKSKGWRWDSKRQRWDYDDVTSRCIDAGNPGSPLGEELLCVPDDPNNEWGENLRINMGAYGGTAEASMPPYDWAIPGDLTNDGVVNSQDFAYQAGDWLNSNEQQPGDLNRDGIIDFADITLLVEDWLKQTSWHE